MIPINVDRNASKRDYESLPVNTLLVTKTFYTFQGEGPFAGSPSVFIRLAGCNIGAKLDCPWCDTKFDIKDGTVTGFEELSSVIDQNPKARVIVITGGEPMLQHTRICCFIDYYRNTRPEREAELHWQMETNGLLIREETFESLSGGGIHYVISPKIPANRGEYKKIPMDWTSVPTANIVLKYVVTADTESPYYNIPAEVPFIAEHYGIPVCISGMAVYKKAPEGIVSIWDNETVDQAATAANYARAADIALKHGFIVSYQTHLFGAKE